MKNVLILGGTGAIGRKLVDFISVNPEIECVVTSRRVQNNKGNIKYIQGNAHNCDFVFSLLDKKWDAIIDFMAYTTVELKERINRFLSATDQYIFISSARVYAESEGLIKEDSPRLLDRCEDSTYLSTDEYALAKAREENIIISNSEQNNYTIIRPYITFSENRFQLGVMEKEQWLYRALRGKSIIFSRDIAEKTTTLTYGGDVAKGIYGLICNTSALGRIYHITTNETHTWETILQLYLKALEEHLGKKINVVYTEKWQPYQGGSEYQVKYDRLYHRRFDNSNIMNDVSLMSFSRLEYSINKAIAEMIHHPSFGSIDFNREAMKDRLTGEWTNIFVIPGVRTKLKYLLIRMGLKAYR